MKRRSKTSSGSIPPLLTDVIREVNRTVISQKAVRDRKKDLSKFAREVDAEDAEIVRDSAIELEFWRTYAIDERVRIAGLFQQLAERGGLTGPDLREQFEALKAGMRFEVQTGTRDSRPFAEPVPVFNESDPDAAHDARIALILIWLAGQPITGYRVLQCAHRNCGRLFLRKPTVGPRSPACPVHVNAYRQARFRLEHPAKKKRAPSKHK